MNIKRCFKLAKNASKFSDHKIKMGSVIIHKNKVISVGWNCKKSSPIQKKYNKYRSFENRVFDVDKHDNVIHAECMAVKNAIRQFNGNLNKCSIFIYSTKKDGSNRLSRPCRACMKMLKDNNIRNVYYLTENGWNYEKI